MASSPRTNRVLTSWGEGQLNELNSILNELQGRLSTVEGRTGEVTVLGDQKIEGRLQLEETAAPDTTELGSIYRTTSYQAQTELWGIEYDAELNRSMRLVTRTFEDSTEVGKASDWDFGNGLDLSLDKTNDVLSISVDESELDHGTLSGLQDNDHLLYQRKHGFDVNDDGTPVVTMSYDPATRIVTITPVGSTYKFWIDGQVYEKTGVQTSAAHTDALDEYFLTYDANGDLQWSTSAWDILDRTATPVAFVYYYDSSHAVCFYEGHTADRVLELHYNLHFSRGTQYIAGGDISGYTLNTGSDAAVTYAISATTLADEDIKFTTSGQADGGSYTVFYRTGAAGDWTYETVTGFPFTFGTTYPEWNEDTGATWQLTELTGAANQFVNYYVVAVPSVTAATDTLIIVGQTVHSTLAAAQSESINDLATGTQFPFLEIRALWQVTISPGAAYGGTHKCRIVGVKDIKQETVSAIVGSPITDHGSLTGLSDDDHTQYLLVDGSRAMAGDLVFSPDATYDIGASGATRPNDIYWADQALAPDGGVFAPSYSFASDAASGMHLLSGDLWIRSTAGANLLAAGGGNVTLWAPSAEAVVQGATAFRPASSNVMNLGGASNLWKNIYWGTQALAPAGTAGVPSYSFASDPDTGLYASASEVLALVAGGQEVFFIRNADASNYSDWTVYDNKNQGLLQAQMVNTGGGAQYAYLNYKNTTAPGPFYISNETAAGLAFRTTGTDRWIIDAGGTLYPAADNTYDVGNTTNGVSQIFLNYGSATDPALAWSDDPDTGIYGTNGFILFATAGTARWGMAGNLFYPATTNTLSIGSAALKLAEINTEEVYPELILFDDFLSGSSATATTIGQMGWTVYTAGGGAVTQATGVAGHPGLVVLTTGATGTNLTSLFHEQNYYMIMLSDVYKVDWVGGHLSTTGSTAVRMQLSPSVTTSNPNGSLGFEALSGDTNWHAITTDGSGSTRTDTGVAIAATTWHNFMAKRTAAQTWAFYIDGSLVATHTGAGNNVPAETTVTQCIVQAVSDGTDRAITTDRIRVFTNLER
jgi:hypothetical protein